MATIIRTVMPEFGASGEGFAIHDAEVDDMPSAYNHPHSAYFVIEYDGAIVGGGGIAPLQGGPANTCELRKMYFLKTARGFGLGQKLIALCMEAARARGFKICYLETLHSMHHAKALYEKNGFHVLSNPMGNTGHFSCDNWYSREL